MEESRELVRQAKRERERHLQSFMKQYTRICTDLHFTC